MALRTDSIVLYWGPYWDGTRLTPGPWGAATLDDCRIVAPGALVPNWHPVQDAATGIALASGQTSGTYRTPIRVVGGLQSWGPCTARLRTGPQTVTFRVTDGLVERYWNGAAWVAATTSAHWTSGADLYAHFPAFLGVGQYKGQRVGFVARLERAAADAPSPVLSEFAAVCRIYWASTSGDLTRASSWNDDLLHRVLIPQTRIELTASVSHEPPTPGARLDYSAGVGDEPCNVVGVEAVFDVTTDPMLQAPLAGTWNGTTKTWTPTTAFPTGHVIHARPLVEPDVVHSANDEIVVDRLPTIVYESARVVGGARGVGFVAIGHDSVQTAVSVAMPDYEEWEVSGRIIAARRTERDALAMRLTQWLGSWVCLVSPTTSQGWWLCCPGTPEPGFSLGSHGESRFVLQVGSLTWPGTERVVPTLRPDGWRPSVAGI